MPDGHITGETLKLENIDSTSFEILSREVILYNRKTGELVSSAFSVDGTFEVCCDYDVNDSTGEYYIVCLDDEDGIEFNALVFDRIKCCESNCQTHTINYTTLQMEADDSQTLTLSDPCSDCCDPCIFTWEITGGDGSLSDSTGLSTIYTAPSSNPDCVNNPTIALKCNGVTVDTITMAVTEYAVGVGSDAWNSPCNRCTVGPMTDPLCGFQNFDRCLFDRAKCDGIIICGIACDGGCCVGGPDPCIIGQGWSCPSPPGDQRTQDMKDNGCCPQQVL